MPAHELGIKCVEARDGVVMTGSLDMSVKLWDASSFKSVATLDCVGDSVMDLEIIAGSWLLAAGVLYYLLSIGGGGREGKEEGKRRREREGRKRKRRCHFHFGDLPRFVSLEHSTSTPNYPTFVFMIPRHAQNSEYLDPGTNSIKIWDIRSRKLYRVLDGCRWCVHVCVHVCVCY